MEKLGGGSIFAQELFITFHMPTWLIIIIVVAVIGAIIGYFASDGNNRVGDAVQSGCVSGAGCGYVLLQLFLWGLGIVFLIWLFGAIFG